MGVLPENIVTWDRNGIEYVYPPSLVGTTFGCPTERAGEIQIVDDVISLNGISRKKNELKSEILNRIDGMTPLPDEFERKLMDRIRSAVE